MADNSIRFYLEEQRREQKEALDHLFRCHVSNGSIPNSAECYNAFILGWDGVARYKQAKTERQNAPAVWMIGTLVFGVSTFIGLMVLTVLWWTHAPSDPTRPIILTIVSITLAAYCTHRANDSADSAEAAYREKWSEPAT